MKKLATFLDLALAPRAGLPAFPEVEPAETSEFFRTRQASIGNWNGLPLAGGRENSGFNAAVIQLLLSFVGFILVTSRKTSL